MKKQFKAVILALVFGTVSGSAQVGYANNISGDKLAVNSAAEFSTFVKQLSSFCYASKQALPY